MMDLAAYGQGELVPLQEIARRQDISPKYLWQVIGPLKSAGLIQAVPGARGGYRLAKKPAAITLKDIVEALEGGCHMTECCAHTESCQRSSDCVARTVWLSVAKSMSGIMQTITLQSIAEQVINKQDAYSLTYVI